MGAGGDGRRPGKLAYYRTFPDRTEPDAYERTLPEVFPDIAPGSFTWVPELERWVWTTFNDVPVGPRLHQPEVFRRDGRGRCSTSPTSASTCCASTRCRSCGSAWAPTARTSRRCTSCCRRCARSGRIAAPGRRLQGGGDRLPARARHATSATGRHEGKECDLAYHNVLMALLWSALASGRVALMTHVLDGMPAVPPGAGWVTYVRCHDDIGWAITQEDAAAVGEDAHLHRRFLADFYAGEFPGSFARGARFQPDAAHRRGAHERHGRLAGRARGGARAATRSRASWRSGACSCSTRSPSRTAGCRSSTWATSSACSTTRRGPTTAHRRDDNRWMHRPPMDWAAAERRHVAGHGRGRALGRAAAAHRRAARHARDARPRRRTSRCGRATTTSTALLRTFAGERLLVLANFTADEQSVRARDSRRARDAAHGAGRRARRPPAARRRRAARPRAVPVPVDHRLSRRCAGRLPCLRVAAVRGSDGPTPTRRRAAMMPAARVLSGSSPTRRIAATALACAG